MKLLATTLLTLATQLPIDGTEKCSMETTTEIDQYTTCLDQLSETEYQSNLGQLSMELMSETGVSFGDLNDMTDDQINDFIARLAAGGGGNRQ